MSIGSSGPLGSIAGSPLAQTQGNDIDRAKHDTNDQKRQISKDESAEQAAGIGETSEDEQTGDRDADGRRPWEFAKPADQVDEQQTPPGQHDTRMSKDPSGERGNHVDLEA